MPKDADVAAAGAGFLRIMALGACGIWWALPISNVVTALITIGVYAKGDWKKKRLIDSEDELTGKVTEEILVGEVAR